MNSLSATYSPDDNKLRLYASTRLDAETYQRVRAAGFKWAPKQELFVAPMWTPAREDLLLELAGEIEDEDSSLLQRAEERAERFDDYQGKRRSEATQASATADEISQAFHMGQPILVGHHSEKRARRDAERIENNMRRAVRLWDTADYWERRAAGAVAHAKYKERPDVRARRIRQIEADQRKRERNKADSEKAIKAWSVDGLTMEQAKAIANFDHVSKSFSLAEFPREEPASQYEGLMSLWSALDGGVINAEQAREIALRVHRRSIAWAERWIAHYTNRLAYERAMLADQGGIVADRTKPEKGGAVRCLFAPGFGRGWAYIVRVNKVSVTILHNYGNGGRNFRQLVPLDDIKAVMTADQVTEARAAGRLVETEDGTGFFLQEGPETTEQDSTAVAGDTGTATTTGKETAAPAVSTEETEARMKVDAMREQLRQGVRVEVAPMLYPTPAELADRMAELAGVTDGMKVLEPSAGTGVLIDAVKRAAPGAAITAVEWDARLAARLRELGHSTAQGDFLTWSPPAGGFDCIVMNPPFDKGSDMTHILRARDMLKPGGVLVAICANGPRQNERLQPLAVHWEALPAGTFKHAGTNVNTALLVMHAP